MVKPDDKVSQVSNYIFFFSDFFRLPFRPLFSGVYPDEQHSAAPGPAGEDVRIDGRSQSGDGRRQYSQRASVEFKHGPG